MTTTGITQANRFIELYTPLGEDYLIVTDIIGSEALSQLFKFTLTVLSSDINIQPEKLLNQTVRFRIGYDDPKLFHGIITEYTTLTDVHTGIQCYSCYQLIVEPWVSSLQHNHDCRIFQEKTTLEIVDQVLQEHSSEPIDMQVIADLPTHNQCTQYQESTWDFISRLLAEAGLSYYFRHTPKYHCLVITDNTEDIATYPTPLPLNFYNLRQPHLFKWQHTYQTVPGKITLADYSFMESASDQTSLIREHTLPESYLTTETLLYPGGYSTTQHGDQLAQIHGEQQRSQHQLIHAHSTCWLLHAGSCFTRQIDDQSTDAYLITAMTHHAHDHTHFVQIPDPAQGAQHYHNELTCIPKAIRFRPPIPKRPSIAGTQTAFVAGPKTETIHTDTLGQIKAHFHWDRRATGDDTSSDWMRTTTLWAGQHWGSQFIPRVQQEVTVSFAHGDPDRPLVLGCVYNSDYQLPYPLPQEKTKTVLRSSTLHNSARYNELSFDDKPDAEQVFLRAEKNYTQTIQQDAHTDIHKDCTIDITGDHTVTVSGNQATTIEQGDQTINLPEGQLQVTAQRITFTVGNNCIELSETGVLLRGPVIDLDTET